MDVAQEMWATFNDDDESWVYGYDIETKKNTSSSAKCKGFAHCFLRLQWREFMNSVHKVVRSKRNSTLKLCRDCAKQFVRNVQNCGKK